jgi:hypothetical protein
LLLLLRLGSYPEQISGFEAERADEQLLFSAHVGMRIDVHYSTGIGITDMLVEQSVRSIFQLEHREHDCVEIVNILSKAQPITACDLLWLEGQNRNRSTVPARPKIR